MKGKKFLAFSLAAAMLVGGTLSVSAAGVSDVFNGSYYAGKYADLKTSIGADEAALLNHAVTSGAKEGRVISPILDVAAYRKAYADLNAAFGDDWDAYVDHYLNYGVKEKRTAGVLFDLVDYANKNADVKAAYGDDYAAIAKHYVTFGIKEGRPGGAIVKEAPKAAAGSTSNNTPTQQPGSTQKPDDTQKPVEVPPQTDSSLAQHKHDHEDFDWSAVFHEYKVNNGATPSWPTWFNGTWKTPTCTEDGYVEWRCSAPVYRDVVDAKGNIVGTIQTGTCDKVMHVVWPKSHKIMTGTANAFLLAPTCQKEGTAKYTCTACGLPITETLPKVDHIYKETKVEPTGCGHDFAHPERLVGYYKYDCIYGCGNSFTKFRDEAWTVERIETANTANTGLLERRVHEKELQPEHQVATYDNVITKATCLTAGKASGYCSKCNEEDTKTVAPLGHLNASNDVRTIYIDSYTTTDQMAGLADNERCHKKVEVTVCGRDGCDVIVAVNPVADEKCTTTDATPNKPLKDKVCDFCKHGMLREYKDHIFEIKVGDFLHNAVGQ